MILNFLKLKSKTKPSKQIYLRLSSPSQHPWYRLRMCLICWHNPETLFLVRDRLSKSVNAEVTLPRNLGAHETDSRGRLFNTASWTLKRQGVQHKRGQVVQRYLLADFRGHGIWPVHEGVTSFWGTQTRRNDRRRLLSMFLCSIVSKLRT